MIVSVFPTVTVTVRAKKLEQSARADDWAAPPRRVPVTARAQLSAEQPPCLGAREAKLTPVRVRRVAIESLIFICEEQDDEQEGTIQKGLF